MLDDVEVPAIGPIIPEVYDLIGSIVVHDEDGVELVGPWGWCRG